MINKNILIENDSASKKYSNALRSPKKAELPKQTNKRIQKRKKKLSFIKTTF